MAVKLDLSKPRYDQGTYIGRAKHFFVTTNPLNLLATSDRLEEAKRVVADYKKTGALPAGYNEEQMWKAKHLQDSAFHPDTGEKMFILGRMSAQVPMNTLITGFMLAFYRSTKATVFWQWCNQSFNSIVNYTNRSGDAQISNSRLLTSYVCATGGALATALYLNSLTKNMPPLLGRLVPFTAVMAANCINIPMMRSQELSKGVPVYDVETNKRLCDSQGAAVLGIALVVLSRVIMGTPSMAFTPIATNYLMKKRFYEKYPKAYIPSQLFMVAFCLTFATPFACALFKQQAHIRCSALSASTQEKIKAQLGGKLPETVVFNKGL